MPNGVPNKRHTGEFKQMVVETMMRDKLSYFVSAEFRGLFHYQVNTTFRSNTFNKMCLYKV